MCKSQVYSIYIIKIHKYKIISWLSFLHEGYTIISKEKKVQNFVFIAFYTPVYYKCGTILIL